MSIESPFGAEALLIKPEQLESWIMEESEDIIVLDKPGWVVCHPSKNGPWSSLVGAVREARGLDRIHLVSRLDRETSGVVILAKHHKAASQLQTAFSKRNTKKRYLALLKGHLKEARTTESNLEKDPESEVVVKQRVSFGGRGKSALTHFRPLEYWGPHTLAEVTPESGRKHQIRVHAAWLEHPVLGDKIYAGDPSWYLEFIENGWTDRLDRELRYPRQALHAADLEVWGEDWKFTFSAPCPFEAEGYRTLAESETA
ncbi:RNA pseudouridine synthase [Puniceicoccales bacterium CK1056]|uniref:RNA pseudouridine synthase n=1 Tax=Oceanipulchritudo coccoides TaxID=2706888 RepID=A0A6B2LZE2_9BACT|nr:RNA pseudouridine synthase [Oceanipulchritudo coccoides]NDV61813.1 RNA pseudouridine synthase [Oceanipulchritudo coccoides]